MDQEKIGCFLKQLRRERGLTQEQLAEQLGVNPRTVSRWETARTMPDFALHIAELTDRFPWDFLSGLGQGTALGMLIVGTLFTSRLGPRLVAGKQKLLKKIWKN